MEELQVIVRQEPGTIKWNFEQLKTALAAEMESYTDVVYTDDSIKSAKSDLAMLRKLRTSVEDKRKEIKDKCLEPYALIEAQAKELTVLIDKPIAQIDTQVKAYEAERRARAKTDILNYMAEKFASLPDDIAARLKSKIYDARWENVTTSKKDWQKAIDEAFRTTEIDINVLESVEEEFRDKAYEVYKVGLVLSEALQKVTELRRQKEEILERERIRKEQEERRRAEEAARAAEQEAQKAAQEAHRPQETTQPSIPATEQPKGHMEAFTRAVEEAKATREQPQELKRIVFDLVGTKEQLNSCYAFIARSGAKFKWQELEVEDV